MNDRITTLFEAIDRQDSDGMRAAYAPDARLVTMTPNTFKVDTGVDEIGARLTDWYVSWEQEPAFSFLSRIDHDGHVFVEFERTSSYEGDRWVVRQSHVLDVGPDGVREHRIYCCGPRQGSPDLAAIYASMR